MEYLVDYVNRRIDDAEEVSHAFLGHKDGNFFERAAAHAVGYAVSPFYSLWKNIPSKGWNVVTPPVMGRDPASLRRAAQAPRAFEQPVQVPAQIEVKSVQTMPPRVRDRRAYTRGRRRGGVVGGRSRNQAAANLRNAITAANKKLNKPKIKGFGGVLPPVYHMPRLRRRRVFRSRNTGMKLNRATGRNLIRSMATPPSAFSATLSTGTYVRLKEGKNCNYIHARIPVGTVNLIYIGTNLTPRAVIQMFGSNDAIAGSYFLGGNSGYMPEPLYDVLVLFQQLRWDAACFEFTPRVQGGTSNGIGLTWGFSADPLYPQDHGFPGGFPDSGYGFGYFPDENQVKPMDGSTSFPAWVPTSCYDATSKLDHKWRYTAGPDVVGSGFYDDTDVAADQRQAYAGVLLIAGSDNARETGSGNEIVNIGSLWMKCVIAVREFAPAATGDATLQRISRNLYKLKEGHIVHLTRLLAAHREKMPAVTLKNGKVVVRTTKRKKKVNQISEKDKEDYVVDSDEEKQPERPSSRSSVKSLKSAARAA